MQGSLLNWTQTAEQAVLGYIACAVLNILRHVSLQARSWQHLVPVSRWAPCSGSRTICTAPLDIQGVLLSTGNEVLNLKGRHWSASTILRGGTGGDGLLHSICRHHNNSGHVVVDALQPD